jgi:hypothetical protein
MAIRVRNGRFGKKRNGRLVALDNEIIEGKKVIW